MHCSSFELDLDRYLEATLTPRRMAQIRRHLNACPRCQALLHEVKVVDALLFTTSPPPLPENFTFRVMADVNTMPVPQAAPHRVWSFLALYSAAAWVAAFITMVVTRTAPASVAATVGNGVHAMGQWFDVAFASLPHSAPQMAAFGIVVLVLDAFIAGAIGYYYFSVRPRLAAVAAPSRRSGS